MPVKASHVGDDGSHLGSRFTPAATRVSGAERLRAAAGLVGVLARDHVIVAAGGDYSFVEAGRWRR